MNEQEVIKYLEQHGHIADDAKDMAINAIEKQIAKKPDVWGDGYADGIYNAIEIVKAGGTDE